MIELKLAEGDYRFASIVWENEPLGSGELVKLCREHFNWKKSTTYTMLKRMCDKGILQNADSVVTARVKREQVQKAESEQFMERTFQGSLPRFITAFMSDKTLTGQEAEEIKQIISRYTKNEG